MINIYLYLIIIYYHIIKIYYGTVFLINIWDCQIFIRNETAKMVRRCSFILFQYNRRLSFFGVYWKFLYTKEGSVPVRVGFSVCFDSWSLLSWHRCSWNESPLCKNGLLIEHNNEWNVFLLVIVLKCLLYIY